MHRSTQDKVESRGSSRQTWQEPMILIERSLSANAPPSAAGMHVGQQERGWAAQAQAKLHRLSAKVCRTLRP